MSGRLRRTLADSPSLPLLLIAVAICIWLGADEGGFRGTAFLPATLVLLSLLALGLLVLPRPRPSRACAVAMGLLVAYAAWSYLSILWADQQGVAWDGANRTLLYAITLALFALWPVGGKAAAAIAGTYALGIAGVGLVELLRAAESENAVAFFSEGRLSEPTGYANANVALWFTAFWPALVLAGRREVPAVLRGLFLGSAGLLAALAVVGQSRGWSIALPFIVLLAIAIVPGRGRTIAAGALVAGAVGAVSGPLLDVYQAFDTEISPTEFFADASRGALIASAALVAVGTAWGLLERAPPLRGANAKRIGVAVVVAFMLAGVAATIAFTATRGSPVTAAADAWRDFKKVESEPSFTGARIGTLGSSFRSDYFRVAWDNFTSHPIVGVGADNYGRDYLIHGRSPHTPAYPHSIELRTLSQTGLIGAILLAGAIGAALFAAARTIRGQPGIGGVAAATSVLAFAYFIVHGSIDWLWEFGGLGTPAFALLGLAVAVGARPRAPGAEGMPGLPAAAAGLCVSLAITAAVGAPWLAERNLRQARQIAASNPAGALEKLDRAAKLNPLSPLADKTAAVIEAKRGRLGPARQRFRETLARDPGDPFVYLQLSALASVTDHRRDALRLIRRARSLNPRDAVTMQVQKELEKGRYVSPQRVNRLILRDIDDRIGPG